MTCYITCHVTVPAGWDYSLPVCLHACLPVCPSVCPKEWTHFMGIMFAVLTVFSLRACVCVSVARGESQDNVELSEEPTDFNWPTGSQHLFLHTDGDDLLPDPPDAAGGSAEQVRQHRKGLQLSVIALSIGTGNHSDCHSCCFYRVVMETGCQHRVNTVRRTSLRFNSASVWHPASPHSVSVSSTGLGRSSSSLSTWSFPTCQLLNFLSTIGRSSCESKIRLNRVCAQGQINR